MRHISHTRLLWWWIFLWLVLVVSFDFPSALGLMTLSSSSTSDSLLVVIGLNGALQKRFVIQDHGNLVPGKVHRASHVQTGVGGKGQDVAIALNCLQTNGIRLVQFLGQGAEGDTVHDLLVNQLGSAAIQETTLRVASPLRTCTSIVGSEDTTELVEPSGTIQSDEIQLLLQLCKKLSSSSNIAGICVMGSMPPGCPSTMYADLYQRLTTTTTTLCVVDSVSGIVPLFQKLTGPTLYKVNRQELCELAAVPEGSPLSQVIPAFLAKYTSPSHLLLLQAIAITDGKRPGHLCWIESADKWHVFEIAIPKLQTLSGTPLYPIGAGDAVAAGTLAAWMALETKSSTALPETCQTALQTKVKAWKDAIVPAAASHLVASFAFGLACGSASCLQEENSVLDVKDVLGLLADLEVTAKE